MWRDIISGIPVIAGIALLAFVKLFPKHRKQYAMGAVAALAFGLVFTFFPIENLFYTFPTAESVAQYAGRGKIITIIEGETSSFVLYEYGENSRGTMIASKTSSGYKLMLSNNCVGETPPFSLSFPSYSASVYSSNQSDYYVVVQGLFDDYDASIGDNRGSKFIMIDGTEDMGKEESNGMLAYAYLKDFSDGYQITIQGRLRVDTLNVERR